VRKLPRKITKSIILLLMAVLLVSSLACFCNLVRAEPAFTLSIDAPIENMTYAQSNLEINIVISYFPSLRLDSLKLTYYLDEQPIASKVIYETHTGHMDVNLGNWDNSTANDRITLTDLSIGKHTFQVKGNGTGEYIAIGNAYESFETSVINFSVEKQNSNQTISTAILSGVIAGAVIVSIALLAIYRKPNLKTKKQPTQEV
jgi:hypothetical protein